MERGPLPLPLSAASGFLMGAADAVPGVSGGTIALVVGVYERLIDGIARVLRLPWLMRTPAGRRQLAEALRFLVPLGLGLVVAYYLVTKLLVGPEAEPGLLRRAETAPLAYGFFFGLVLLSLREPWRRIEGPGASCWVVAAIAAAVAFLFTGLPHATGQPETWMLVYGGAGAIAVMLLPGVSGSLLLLVLGQYTTVTQAVHDLAWPRLAATGLGVLLGLGTFVPLLRWLLRRHRAHTLAALTGLMAGSLRALWPWKANYDVASGPLTNVGIGGQVPWVLLAAALGGATVLVLGRLERLVVRADPDPAGAA